MLHSNLFDYNSWSSRLSISRDCFHWSQNPPCLTTMPEFLYTVKAKVTNWIYIYGRLNYLLSSYNRVITPPPQPPMSLYPMGVHSSASFWLWQPWPSKGDKHDVFPIPEEAVNITVWFGSDSSTVLASPRKNSVLHTGACFFSLSPDRRHEPRKPHKSSAHLQPSCNMSKKQNFVIVSQ